ncbi:Metallo-hydrolase/oxidoreductase [Dendrothele bispora CBS 962.96]|uniref:Metallo-hydrolase/oxidoreductase n=1 Tax=Dendrothele bispora (strain CBS 962.96) TaxID=1314807 RepID=A0A4S8MSG6_DENBC|nr:Metallo-hydrolase/oxidoreductase [Dendrothele bispora CBS 962.96]
MALPPPAQDQAYCDVSALEAGMIELPLIVFLNELAPDSTVKDHSPSLSFLLKNNKKPEKFIFDLGIRKDWENYPPAVVEGWIKTIFPVDVPEDPVESLAKGGLTPNDIDYVCLSHVHFDHVGDPSLFPKSTFLVGAEAQPLFKPGYPADPNAGVASDLLPEGRTRFLDASNWGPLGPFPRALDFYGDGSLYIIDAPGHLPGHINVVARTSSDGAWILLGGDCAHHWSLVTGEYSDIACHDVFGCAHEDKEKAKEHIGKIRELMEVPRVKVLLAHDERWYNEHKGSEAFWPGVIQSA